VIGSSKGQELLTTGNAKPRNPIQSREKPRIWRLVIEKKAWGRGVVHIDQPSSPCRNPATQLTAKGRLPRLPNGYLTRASQVPMNQLMQMKKVGDTSSPSLNRRLERSMYRDRLSVPPDKDRV
jgi:hypothetical protein